MSSTNFVAAVDATQPADTAAGLVKLRFTTLLNGGSTPTVQAQLSSIASRTAVSVSCDATTALPSSVTFAYVLDNDPRHVIEYDIVFADYRPEGGFMIPHHIQRYIQRSLQADITITSVTTTN